MEVSREENLKFEAKKRAKPSLLVRMRQGNLIVIRERLAQNDPGNADWPRDLLVSYEKIGDVQIAQATFKPRSNPIPTASPLPSAAQKDPGNAGWQRDLSVSYEKIGDVQMAQGDLQAALKSYSDGLAIAERLAKSDPATLNGSIISGSATKGWAT